MSQKENFKTKKLYFELFKIAQYKTENYIEILAQKENFKTKKLYFELFKIAQYKAGNEFRKSQLFLTFSF